MSNEEAIEILQDLQAALRESLHAGAADALSVRIRFAAIGLAIGALSDAKEHATFREEARALVAGMVEDFEIEVPTGNPTIEKARTWLAENDA